MTNELIQRYLLPEPRLALGLALHTIAHASIDISDGLLQDLDHICKASNVGATIYRERIPLSEAARQYPDQWELSLSGGDDYELLFTADAAHQAAIAALANDLQLPITAIGSISEEQGVRLLDAQSNDIPVAHNGYQHF